MRVIITFGIILAVGLAVEILMSDKNEDEKTKKSKKRFGMLYKKIWRYFYEIDN